MINAPSTRTSGFMTTNPPAPFAKLVHPSKGVNYRLDLTFWAIEAATFAAEDRQNNRKLAKDVAKLSRQSEECRYVFFAFPLHQ